MKISKSIFGCGMAIALSANVANAQDTPEEKAEKLQSLIDRQQDSKIDANKDAIEEIKKGNKGRKNARR